MSHNDSDVRADVAAIKEGVTWIKAAIQKTQDKQESQQKEIDEIKRRINYVLGGFAAVEFIIHIASFFKSPIITLFGTYKP